MLDKNLKRIQFQESESAWIRSFTVESIKCLIVCRGPVRKETMDVFDAIGVKEYGILLSEKDSIVYPKALAPELRNFRFPENIHRVPDYMGAGKEEKEQRIHQIIGIAKDNGYTHIFAGYGFMAEDAEFIEAIEKAGIIFMGPSSHVAKGAGAKDEAKKLARSLNVSVTPGVDNITALALLRKTGNSKDGLLKVAKENNLNFSLNDSKSLEDNAEDLLQLSYEKTIDITSIPDLQKESSILCEDIWKKYPGKRIRFKYIGGGGGKGQRVISEKSEIDAAVMEILAESKVTAVGSNRNFLIELNIENTRHNEIQLIGNGEWSLSLGGRDCSLQMHEQKLLEISQTVELLQKEADLVRSTNAKKAAILDKDVQTLKDMEHQAEVFGKAIRLNSVSTFECIVEGNSFFFMEVNTRIQVEHRVTEMVYKMKFTNPNDPNDFFYIDSLVEAMAVLSIHGPRVPKPERILRNISGAEVRINATNRALQPHAGGIIQNWSKALPEEIRDDQGICTRNPDTGAFVHYNLAGAYDSNVALLVSYGNSRTENLEILGNILRKTELRGQNLETNLLVHYGLIQWILGKDAMFKPSTAFMISYLAGIGALQSIINDLDLEYLWTEKTKASDADLKKILNKKMTLVIRPMERLLANPHLLGGFLGYFDGKLWTRTGSNVEFNENPIQFLDSLYYYLNLDTTEEKASSEKIWDHDAKLLSEAKDFYTELSKRTGLSSWKELSDALTKGKNPSKSLSDDLWNASVASHNGFQAGLETLLLLPKIGIKSNFFGLDVNADLDGVVPDEFKNKDTRDAFIKMLNPPPKMSGDEIVAPMGGMFYSKEAPNLPPLINEGDHFQAGQPLFIIEVMKMFNKILAPVSGTIVKNLMVDSDGKIVTKAQPIFKIKPDEVLKEESPEEIRARKVKVTKELGLG
ncbi:biotin/lipoyl-containing protein [Leptospira bandrabouensis]|uniref:ATP-binding protein n=1 Tax=Leptospira bandrabouensis TaxID=2484903 RepID=UPI001EE87644|nr:biotin/lipoyl-containing protein [Leptospira bandrabouensis]MCG6145449.1 biotin carboxylase [Leptospira bandrabouensis]MCG6161073.1 biotin carboxylase [Leptospira bandrabouensis]MCG6164803.1 biotin carboxylase [Leptospira bandrabouensis]